MGERPRRRRAHVRGARVEPAAQDRGRPGLAPAARHRARERLQADRRLARLRLDQAAADRVAGQLDAVAHAELVEDVLPVALDGLDADHELLGDLLRRVRLGDQLQHLQLARRQDVELLARPAGRARRSRARAS